MVNGPRHSLFIIKPGCTSLGQFTVSPELVKNGEEDDLGFLGSDLTGGGIIKLQVIHKQVSVWINKQKDITRSPISSHWVKYMVSIYPLPALVR